VIANTTPEPFENFKHVEHTLEPVHGEINSEAPRRSKRQRTAKFFMMILLFISWTTLSKLFQRHLHLWMRMIRKKLSVSEMDSILSNGTWELFDQPYGYKLVGSKWVFKKKVMPDVTIDKYKARLVDKSYTQKEGEIVFYTYSLVPRLVTIHFLHSLTAWQGLLVHQIEIKTTFP
jgi:hypothetical protein